MDAVCFGRKIHLKPRLLFARALRVTAAAEAQGLPGESDELHALNGPRGGSGETEDAAPGCKVGVRGLTKARIFRWVFTIILVRKTATSKVEVKRSRG